MRLTTLLVLSTAALGGCVTRETRQREEIMRHYERLGEQARTATVDPSDGVSEVEAYKIGLDRFRTYHTACGATSLRVDLGDYWRITTSAGDAGIPVEDILIRKSDGFTTITKANLYNPPNRVAGGD